MSMIDYVFQQTIEYIDHMPKSLRKKYGQFFTSPETAIFMAELFEIPRQKSLSILDPGAGSGILSVALIERLQSEPYIEKIDLIFWKYLVRTSIGFVSTLRKRFPFKSIQITTSEVRWLIITICLTQIRTQGSLMW